jgi:hypothetical protein
MHSERGAAIVCLGMLEGTSADRARAAAGAAARCCLRYINIYCPDDCSRRRRRCPRDLLYC